MPSRREQIQSYQYLMQRVVNAFVSGEADPSMSPTRRLAGAGFASVMAAVLVLAVFGVIGLVRHGGNTSWQDNGAVVIEKETGTRYVYRDGVLYPVANFASAVLAVGRPVTTVTVSRESLVGAARGPLIGIAGAPDALPPTGRLLRDAWSTCAVSGRDAAGGTTVTSMVLVGHTPAGGHPLGGDGVLVRDTAQKTYLIWNGHRFLFGNQKYLAALGIDQQPKLLVDGAWLNTVPVGVQITQPTVDGRGKSSTAVKDHLVGQVLTVASGGTTIRYLVRGGDLLPITAVQQALILADSGTAAAYPGSAPAALAVQPAEVANAPKAGVPAVTDLDPPAEVPAMTGADPDSTVCSTFADGRGDPTFLIGGVPPAPTAGIATNGSASDEVADRVVVPPGSGALVRSAPSPEAGSGTVFLVTDQGRRFALAGTDQLAWFGYGAVKPIVLPAPVVARIPAGPALDPRAAQRPLTG